MIWLFLIHLMLAIGKLVLCLIDVACYMVVMVMVGS